MVIRIFASLHIAYPKCTDAICWLFGDYCDTARTDKVVFSRSLWRKLIWCVFAFEPTSRDLFAWYVWVCGYRGIWYAVRMSLMALKNRRTNIYSLQLRSNLWRTSTLECSQSHTYSHTWDRAQIDLVRCTTLDRAMLSKTDRARAKLLNEAYTSIYA